MSLSPEVIEQNWNKVRTLCGKLGERSEPMLKMIDDLDIRLCLCPASAKRDFHNAFPGGLCAHSLSVLQNLVVLNNTHGWKLSKDSMIIAALCHDIGKVGLPGKGSENDYYVPQTEQWRIDKNGEIYTYNKTMQFMTTPHRSVFIMQHYQIKLSPDEFLAILCNDGFVVDENKPYCLRVGHLVYALQQADYCATMSEKHVGYWTTTE